MVVALLIEGALYSSVANHAQGRTQHMQIMQRDGAGGEEPPAPPISAQRRLELPLERLEDLGAHAGDVLLVQRAVWRRITTRSASERLSAATWSPS